MGAPANIPGQQNVAAAAAPAAAPKRKWWVAEVWEEDRPLIVLIYSDLFVFVALLSTLLVSFFGLKGLEYYGILKDHIVILEKMHFWATCIAYVAVIGNFYWKMVMSLFLVEEI